MKLYKSLIVTALFSLCFVSCDDENYFDQDRYTALIEQAFPVDSVDRNHDWKTVGTVTANITVNTVEPCVIKVYANNPFTDGKGVMLMEKNISVSSSVVLKAVSWLMWHLQTVKDIHISNLRQ